MNRLTPILVASGALSFLAADVAAAELRARLVWKDDRDRGPVKLRSLSTGGKLLTDEGAAIERGDLDAVIFLHSEDTNTVDRPVNLLELRDGGQVGGELRRIGEKVVEIESTSGEYFRLPSQAVRSVRWTDEPAGVSYEGPYTQDRWVIGGLASSRAGPTSAEPAWKFEDGIFVSQGKGTLACECDMPPIARVEFDLHWQDRPRFRMAFFQRDMVNYTHGEGFHFYSSGSGSIYAITRGRNPARGIKFERRPVPSLVTGNHAHLDFRVNSHTGEGWLFADGEEIRHWTDLGYAGSGTGLMILNYHDETRLGVSNLRVSQWDGRSAHAPKPAGNTKTIIFRNGDTTETRKLFLLKTNITFAFKDSEITIPTTRVAQIYLPGHEEAVAQKETVWIHFLRGDWIQGKDISYTNGVMRWRDVWTDTARETPVKRIRGLHYRRDKPVMDLSWYLPTMPPPRDTE